MQPRGFAAQRRSRAGAGAVPARDAFAEANAALDAAMADADAKLQAASRTRFDELMRDHRGVSAHDMATRPATHLHEAILAAAGADHELRAEIPSLLTHAITHQRNFIRKLDADGCAPLNAAVQTLSDLGGGDDPAALSVMLPDLAAQPDGQAEAAALMNDLLALKRELLVEREIFRRDEDARGHLISQTFSAQLRTHLEGEDLHGAHSLLDAARGRSIAGISELIDPAHLSTGHLALASRYVRAHRELGIDVDAADATLRRDLEGDIGRHLLSQRGGDEAERALWVNEPPEAPWLEPADTPERALTLVRALLRSPWRFADEFAVPAPDGELQVRVHTTLDVLLQMHGADTPFGRRFVEAVVGHEPASPKGQRRRVHLELRYVLRIGEEHQVVSLTADLGRTTAGRMRNTGWAIDLLMAAGGEHIARDGIGIEGDYGTPPPRTEVCEVSRKLRDELNFAGWPAKRIRNATEALGPDECAHSGGRWLPHFGEVYEVPSPVPVAARYHCDDCLRSQVVVMPLHRFPHGHPMRAPIVNTGRSRAGAEEYLRWRRFYDLLGGRGVPAGSIEELEARDGTVDPDAVMSAPRTSTRRVRSIRDAMARR